MIKKLLKVNREIVSSFVPSMFLLGVVMVVVLGTVVRDMGGQYNIEINAPMQVGALMYWGGFTLLVMFMVELARQVYVNWIREKMRKAWREKGGYTSAVRRRE